MESKIALGENETLLWCKYPSLKAWFSYGDLLTILVWLFFFAVLGKIIGQNNSNSLWFCILLLAIAIYFIAFYYYIKFKRKSKEIYYLTNKRLIVSYEDNIKSIDLIKSGDIKIKDCTHNGVGTVIVGKTLREHAWFLNTGIEYVYPEVYFGTNILVLRDIPDAQAVFDQLKKYFKPC